MINDYVIVFGDCNKFIEDCKLQLSDLIRLVNLKDSIKQITGGKCSTLEELFSNEKFASVSVLGSFKNDQQLFDQFNKTVHEFVIEDGDDEIEEEYGIVFRTYRVGGELKHIYLRNKTDLDVIEAKRLKFPERYIESQAVLLGRGRTLLGKKKGRAVELDLSAFRLSRDIDKEPKHLGWYNTTIFKTFDRVISDNDEYTVFKKRGPLKAVPELPQDPYDVSSTLDRAFKFLYETMCEEDTDLDTIYVPASGWELAAARGVVAALTNRKGFYFFFDNVDTSEERKEILDKLAIKINTLLTEGKFSGKQIVEYLSHTYRGLGCMFDEIDEEIVTDIADEIEAIVETVKDEYGPKETKNNI